jgi:hypothetical protein
MAAWTPIPLATQLEDGRSLVNMYAEPVGEGKRSRFVLKPTAGLTPFAEPGSGACRGLIVMGDYLYAVLGEELYRVGRDGSADLIGAIAGTRDCFLTENGQHVGIAADTDVYAANDSGVSWVNGDRMNGAAGQDGYGIYTRQGSQDVFIAGPDDLTTISPIDFTAADAQSDKVMGCLSTRRQLAIFKERSVEFYDNTGAASFPFERAGGGFIEHGCVASGSIAGNGEIPVWLGRGKSGGVQVFRTDGGYQAIPISTPYVESLIAEVVDPSAARAFVYTTSGGTFYALNFATISLECNLRTGKWHERRTTDKARWRAHHHAFFADKHIVGDFETGALYELDTSADVEDDVAIERRWASEEIHADGSGLIFNEVWLDAKTGVGNTTGNDTDPELFLRWSDDSGRTWSNQRSAKLGKVGEYGKQVNYTRLGRTRRHRILEFATRSSVEIEATACKGRLEVMA